MVPFFTALAAALSRNLEPRRPGAPSLLRLIGGEVAWAGRQALHPVKTATAAIVAIGVGLLLGPSTPGPVLGSGWRLGVAVALGFVALSMSHSLLQRGRGLAPEADRELVVALRTALAVVVVLLVGTFVVAYLLAAITGSQPGAVPVGLTAALQIDRPMLGISALMLVAVVTAGLGHRLALPGSLLFLALGMAVGSDGLGWIALDDPQLVQSIGVVALVVILFDGGLSTTVQHLRSGLGPGLALATVGVAVTAGVTALGAIALLDVPSRIAWLLGAIVASTDASAVFALIRRAPIPDRLAAILQIESGANDPVAILLTVGLLAGWDAPPNAWDWVSFGAMQLLGGVVVGALIGWIGARLLVAVSLGTNALYPVLALALAGLSYGTASAIGASGFFAVFVAGIVLASESPRRRSAITSFVGVLSSGVEIGLFLLLGLLVFPSELPAVAFVSLGVVALLVLVARPLATVVSLSWFRLPAREVAAVGWLGMRGAVPIVLATLAFSSGVQEANLIFDVVFFMVLATTVLHGLTSTRVLRRLGLPRSDLAGRAQAVVSALPLDQVGIDVIEVDVSSTSGLVGRRLADTTMPEDALMVALVRGEDVLLPSGATVLRVGDRLVVATRDQAAGLGAIEQWASRELAP